MYTMHYMGTLFIVSTPIGNLEDITIRAIHTLCSVNYILCEDTRKTGQFVAILQKRYESLLHGTHHTPRYIRYDNLNEQERSAEIIEIIKRENNVALVCNSGTPLLSDPGFRIVTDAVKEHIPIVPIPGANAAITALSISGLPTAPFLFMGFLPKKPNHRKQVLKRLQAIHVIIHSTFVLYCSPHDLLDVLYDMKDAYGNIHIVIAHELTKIHESVFQNTISTAQSLFQQPKGEFVLLFTLTNGQ